MRIFFLTAPYDIVKSGYGSNSKVKYGNQPPLGILYMVGELRRHGHECQLIDLATFPMSFEETVSRIKDFGADFVGISTMTPSAAGAFEVAKYVKNHLRLPVIMGGVHCTSFKETVLKEVEEIDAICIGEGEHTIVDYARALEGTIPIEDVKGIYHRDSRGEIVRNEPRSLIADLDTLAFPARDLLDHSAYRLLPLSFKRSPVTSMITSRGCPYGHCSFCFEAGNHAFKFRRHSPEYVIKEIEETIIPHGIREISFWDDIFLLKKGWMREFCGKMKELDLVWSCYGWPKATTREMLSLASEAGCWSVFWGFESGDQNLLDTLKKNITLDDCRKAAKWTHEAGMATRASFMLALPGETPALAKKTIDFAIELDCTFVQFLPTWPEAGTELYEMALKEGKVVKYSGHMKAHYVPDGYRDAEQIERIARNAYLRFYLRPRWVWKQLRRIESFSDLYHYFNALMFFIGMFKKRTAPEPEPVRCIPSS